MYITKYMFHVSVYQYKFLNWLFSSSVYSSKHWLLSNKHSQSWFNSTFRETSATHWPPTAICIALTVVRCSSRHTTCGSGVVGCRPQHILQYVLPSSLCDTTLPHTTCTTAVLVCRPQPYTVVNIAPTIALYSSPHTTCGPDVVVCRPQRGSQLVWSCIDPNKDLRLNWCGRVSTPTRISGSTGGRVSTSTRISDCAAHECQW